MSRIKGPKYKESVNRYFLRFHITVTVANGPERAIFMKAEHNVITKANKDFATQDFCKPSIIFVTLGTVPNSIVNYISLFINILYANLEGR